MQPNYPLTRKGLANCLNRLKGSSISLKDVLSDKEFNYYHRNRNFFNDKYSGVDNVGIQISKLTQIGNVLYLDNLGRKWTEIIIGTTYHRPFTTWKDKTDYVKELFGDRNKKYSRKFISTDEHMAAAGYNGGAEFELVIRDGLRITDGALMETYNFGATGAMSSFGPNGLHGKFDMKTHEKDASYVTSHYHSSFIRIVDFKKK